jgi:hypothetical protein
VPCCRGWSCASRGWAPRAGDGAADAALSARAWQAGTLAVLLPLAGTLGVLALPDVPLTFATLLCLHACARLLRRVEAAAVLELAAGLAIGGLSHYRFIAVIGVGAVVLLALPSGPRAAARRARVGRAGARRAGVGPVAALEPRPRRRGPALPARRSPSLAVPFRWLVVPRRAGGDHHAVAVRRTRACRRARMERAGGTGPDVRAVLRAARRDARCSGFGCSGSSPTTSA